MSEGISATSAEQRKEVDALIGKLEADPKVARDAALLDGAERRRSQLFRELRVRRQARNLSQVQLARTVGTSQPAVARLEAGFADPKLSTLDRLAEALGYELHLVWRPVKQSGATNLQASGTEQLRTMVEKLIAELHALGADAKERRGEILQPVTIEFPGGTKSGYVTVDRLPDGVTMSGVVNDIEGIKAVEPVFDRANFAGHPVSFYYEIAESNKLGVP